MNICVPRNEENPKETQKQDNKLLAALIRQLPWTQPLISFLTLHNITFPPPPPKTYNFPNTEPWNITASEGREVGLG